jgi:hypothetical protein
MQSGLGHFLRVNGSDFVLSLLAKLESRAGFWGKIL